MQHGNICEFAIRQISMSMISYTFSMVYHTCKSGAMWVAFLPQNINGFGIFCGYISNPQIVGPKEQDVISGFMLGRSKLVKTDKMFSPPNLKLKFLLNFHLFLKFLDLIGSHNPILSSKNNGSTLVVVSDSSS
uniref:Uncharacterized protein n=1 Tax=Cucumis melo TaxID=3656 RepID=A0A9I9EEB8_CUCME